MLTCAVGTSDHTRRLESFLRTLMPQASAGYARKLIKSGAARLNGATSTPDSFLASRDTVTLKESAALTALLREERPALDLLYEDDLIAISEALDRLAAAGYDTAAIRAASAVRAASSFNASAVAASGLSRPIAVAAAESSFVRSTSFWFIPA